MLAGIRFVFNFIEQVLNILIILALFLKYNHRHRGFVTPVP